MSALEPDAVDALLLDEAPAEIASAAVFDAPALVPALLERTDDVRVFCDDFRDASAVPHDVLAEHPDELGGAAVAMARLPKSLGALDEMAVSSLGADDVMFLGGARDRHMNKSMNSVLERYFTAVNASLGRQKSRVLRAWGPVAEAESEWPKLRAYDEHGFTLAAHGATFGGTKIDAGTQFLLESLDVEGDEILDFGCGNGSLSLWLAARGKRVAAVDVSWAAIAGTQIGAAASDLDVATRWADGTASFPEHSFDAIVTNPPFHRGTAKDSDATLALFDDARRLLRPGGELWCVYNSHLPWRRELNARLGRTRVVAQNRQYTVAVSVAP
ncbi:MAG: methyltransferase [Propionibacterium sp.]|nr:methyltransferase [Propionibacterium sp.]